MGLCLFPGDGDVTSPDLSLSCTSFHRFRQRLAQAEGFELSQMQRFGGDRLWSDVSTTLEPLLDHPDDDGELSAAQCGAVIPRLEQIAARWEADGGDAVMQQHIDYCHQLVVVMKFCVAEDVELIFG
ncbi:hypothetical protein [Kitasatospora sp. NRRL B-11411]|uniref:hypothetical protein n=1 Tax=Kitasatospora sp. NRRL B-11411 TaxID=1463822 RepID=UPI0004C3C0B6|nr:hypothetical protein [Kitasatospora sp. NRRL B-11411]